MILPVSSLITGNPAEQRSYDQLLDTVSGPLMRALVGTYAFAPAQKTYPDGIRSNFEFQGDAIAKPVWRYLADLLARTIRDEMREQSHYLRRHARPEPQLKTSLRCQTYRPTASFDRWKKIKASYPMS